MVINEIYLYDLFPDGGGTPDMSEAWFLLLNATATGKIGRIEIVDSEFNEIQTIISSAKAKRYNKDSRNLSGNMMLFEIIDTDGVVHRMYTSYESGFFDIDGNIFYSIDNKDHKLWIKLFREKYKK